MILETDIVPPFTSRVYTKLKLPTHVAIKNLEGLDKNSVVLLEQIRTIDKQRLQKFIGTVSGKILLNTDKALAISVGLLKLR